MPTPKKVQTKQPSNNVCCFCNSDEDNELLYGKIHRMGDIVTHYYCLLLSSNMEQNGADNEGILGFMREDILKELRRGKRLICSYCKTNGATLGCCITRCKRVFHLPCGQKAGSLHQFFGQFKSYCSSHRPMQRVDPSLQNGQQTCAICYEDVVPRPTNSTLWASCCRKNAWFHRNCVQQLAMSAGYFFKCPLCNNKSTFQTTMLNYGIYIPERDASWELVPNAFQELLHRHNRCDSPTPCLCPKGRNYDMQGTRWELVLCHLCGSQGVHLGCGNLKWTDPKWECNECKEMLANAHERNDEPAAETNGNEGSTPNIADQSRSRGRRSNARSQHRLGRSQEELPSTLTPLTTPTVSSVSQTPSPMPIVIDDSDDEIEIVEELSQPQEGVQMGDGTTIPVTTIAAVEDEHGFCIEGDVNVVIPDSPPAEEAFEDKFTEANYNFTATSLPQLPMIADDAGPVPKALTRVKYGIIGASPQDPPIKRQKVTVLESSGTKVPSSNAAGSCDESLLENYLMRGQTYPNMSPGDLMCRGFWHLDNMNPSFAHTCLGPALVHKQEVTALPSNHWHMANVQPTSLYVPIIPTQMVSASHMLPIPKTSQENQICLLDYAAQEPVVVANPVVPSRKPEPDVVVLD